MRRKKMDTEKMAESVVNRTVSPEDPEGWSKVANRHILITDIVEALTQLRNETLEEAANTVVDYCGDVFTPDDMPHPEQIAKEIRKRKDGKQ